MDLVEAERFGDKHDYDYELVKNMANVNDAYDACVSKRSSFGHKILTDMGKGIQR